MNCSLAIDLPLVLHLSHDTLVAPLSLPHFGKHFHPCGVSVAVCLSIHARPSIPRIVKCGLLLFCGSVTTFFLANENITNGCEVSSVLQPPGPRVNYSKGVCTPLPSTVAHPIALICFLKLCFVTFSSCHTHPCAALDPCVSNP